LIFLRERVTALLESAVKNNLLDYQLLKADDIQKNDAIYKLTVRMIFRISWKEGNYLVDWQSSQKKPVHFGK
jgi:hypothetical protein